MNRLAGPDDQDFDWESYEELVKDVYAALGRADGVTIECWGRTCRVLTAGGVPRQVDVLTKHGDGSHAYRTAISCKWWSTRVDVAHVSDFAMTVQDARLDKGIIVSKMGFTSPAQQLAEAKGIGLVVLRKPLDADWEGTITSVYGEIVYEAPAEYRYDLRLTKKSDVSELRAPQDCIAAVLPSPHRCTITEPDGRNMTLWERVNAECPQPDDGTQLVVEFPAGTTLNCLDDPNHPADGAFINTVNVQIRVPEPMTSIVEINVEDRIYMIRESLFDGTRYNITDDGEIIETS